MDLISAIRSGKPFKRKHHKIWTTVQVVDDGDFRPGSVDITSDDWEIQEEKIELTAEQIRKVIDRAWLACAPGESKLDFVIKELGFKE